VKETKKEGRRKNEEEEAGRKERQVPRSPWTWNKGITMREASLGLRSYLK